MLVCDKGDLLCPLAKVDPKKSHAIVLLQATVLHLENSSVKQ